jgi:hypothetical protein
MEWEEYLSKLKKTWWAAVQILKPGVGYMSRRPQSHQDTKIIDYKILKSCGITFSDCER